MCHSKNETFTVVCRLTSQPPTPNINQHLPGGSGAAKEIRRKILIHLVIVTNVFNLKYKFLC